METKYGMLNQRVFAIVEMVIPDKRWLGEYAEMMRMRPDK